MTLSVPRRVAEFEKGPLWGGDLSSDGHTVAYRVLPGGEYKPEDTKNIYLCDTRGDAPSDKYVLKGHTATVMAVAWSPDGKAPSSAGEDRSIENRNWKTAILANGRSIVRNS